MGIGCTDTPEITGVGHGDVFTHVVEIENDLNQFASNKLIGQFAVYGYALNALNIFESPEYGVSVVSWENDHGDEELAVLPVLRRDEGHGTYFIVGVVEDPRYNASNFHFTKIQYNDFGVDRTVEASYKDIAWCDEAKYCAPLAPFKAYALYNRSWLYGANPPIINTTKP